MSYVNAGRMGLLGAPTFPMLRDATQRSLLEILEANRIPYELNKGENSLSLADTGSRILFRSMEEYERLRGTNLAWFGVDELTYTCEEAWLRLEGRLRDPKASKLCGFAVWTPNGHDWVYERFVSNRPAGYDVVLAKPFENRYLLEQVPDYYERLRTSYGERFYRQEVLGEYLSLNGARAYHAFERGENVTEVKPQDRLPLLWALDFNVDPMCSVVAQMDGARFTVLDEIVLSRASTRDACEEFVRRFPQRARSVVIYGDATGNRQQSSGTTDYQIIRKFFVDAGFWDLRYKVPKSNPLVRQRVELVNSKLRTASGEVLLQVNPRCRELIKDFEEVTFQAGTMALDKSGDLRRTHLTDALGYLIWEESGPRQEVGPRNKRLL
jgi:hypothetical protein